MCKGLLLLALKKVFSCKNKQSSHLRIKSQLAAFLALLVVLAAGPSVVADNGADGANRTKAENQLQVTFFE